MNTHFIIDFQHMQLFLSNNYNLISWDLLLIAFYIILG